jgi:hypothetical protein
MRRSAMPVCVAGALVILLLCTAGCLYLPSLLKGSAAGTPVATSASANNPVTGESSYVIVRDSTPVETPVPRPPGYERLAIVPDFTGSLEYREFNFRYRSDSYSVRIPVNTSLYRAAHTSPNKNMVTDNASAGLFYHDMMTDPAMDSFYRDLIKEIRKARYKGGYTLTDDEYLEMLTSFVQQIPYDNTTVSNPRYPVEVIYEGKGDCDEKAMLLDGILSREGYDVALLVFPTLKHATSGIRINLASNTPSFRVFSDDKRDYVYIETTTTRLIGFYEDTYEQAPQPVVVPVGNGTLQYRKINYVMKIFADLKTIERQLKMLQEKAGPSNTLSADDYKAAVSYINAYNFIKSTNDREAAMSVIQNSELPHHTTCVSCN